MPVDFFKLLFLRQGTPFLNQGAPFLMGAAVIFSGNAIAWLVLVGRKNLSPFWKRLEAGVGGRLVAEQIARLCFDERRRSNNAASKSNRCEYRCKSGSCSCHRVSSCHLFKKPPAKGDIMDGKSLTKTKQDI